MKTALMKTPATNASATAETKTAETKTAETKTALTTTALTTTAQTRTARTTRSALRLAAGAFCLSLALVGGCDGEKKGGPERGPRPAAVRAAPVTRGDLVLSSRYPGELWAVAADIAPRTTGILVEVTARLGDRVEQGALLARLDDALVRRELDEARASVLTAQANAKRAEANLVSAKAELERKAPLVEDRLISPQELSDLEGRVRSLEAEVEAAKASAAQAEARVGLLVEQRRDMRLVAPFAGIVAERKLDPGATASPQTPVLRLVASGPPEVRFRVPERALGAVREGLSIHVRTAATGEQPFAGKVTRVGGEVSRADRSVPVEGVLTEEAPLLKPGMYATVELEEQDLEDVLLVPAPALLSRLMDDRERPGVFVAMEDRAEWRDVVVLGRQGDVIAVDGKLTPGERVLTLGHEELASGGLIRIVSEERAASASEGERG